MAAFADVFIDESGQRATSAKSSDHFVPSAVVVMPNAMPKSATLLAKMRQELGRQPGDVLHWRNIKTHAQRVRAAQLLGTAPFLRVTTVVVCKRDFAPAAQKMPDEDYAYLYTLRLLLEQLSWIAQRQGFIVHYTLSHIVRFRLAKLRAYEARLQQLSTTIVSASLDPKGGRIDHPRRVEQLQLADIAASATALAFEPDGFGNTEPRYLDELRPRLYCPSGKSHDVVRAQDAPVECDIAGSASMAPGVGRAEERRVDRLEQPFAGAGVSTGRRSSAPPRRIVRLGSDCGSPTTGPTRTN